ncbi:MAG: cytochrome [Actinomycetia bacterium]|nr:cytochrome [Actinomycetes bacterium]
MADDIPGRLLLDRAVISDPYPLYRRLRAEAPVWEVPGTGVFTVSTFDLVAEASSRVEDFSSNMLELLYRDDQGLPGKMSLGDSGPQVLATADAPFHALHRSTVFPELVAKRMRALEPDVTGIADDCVARALDRGTVEFMEEIGNVVPITMISRLIGFQDWDLGQLLTAAFDSTAMVGATLSLEELNELLARSAEVWEYIDQQIATALATPSDDLLGAAARGIQDEVFDAFEATVMLQTLLSAGGESTTSLLGNSVRMLAEDRELQRHLREEPNEIPNFIEEALRLEAPFRFHMRSVPEDTSLGGVDIPAGATVLLLWGSANRDPAEFDRPDALDLGRRVTRHHLAFGRGAHHCVGAPLARMEARIVLSVLLERTTQITLATEGAPDWVDSLMVRRHRRLPLRLA